MPMNNSDAENEVTEAMLKAVDVHLTTKRTGANSKLSKYTNSEEDQVSTAELQICGFDATKTRTASPE